MSKEKQSTTLKQLVLSILEAYSGDPEGLERSIFIDSAAKMTGLSTYTIEQILKEQSGQFIHNRKGRIIVKADAIFISTTSRAPKASSSSTDSGTLRGKVPWTWRK